MHWLTGKRCKLHQNISVYYGFLHGGGNTTMYLMTEFVNGQTLYSAIREAGRFGEPEAANVCCCSLFFFIIFNETI
jgi:serine/threonine protein kinase